MGPCPGMATLEMEKMELACSLYASASQFQLIDCGLKGEVNVEVTAFHMK